MGAIDPPRRETRKGFDVIGQTGAAGWLAVSFLESAETYAGEVIDARETLV
jgi:hypothetical protein